MDGSLSDSAEDVETKDKKSHRHHYSRTHRSHDREKKEWEKSIELLNKKKENEYLSTKF
jgi:hypothetical protein